MSGPFPVGPPQGESALPAAPGNADTGAARARQQPSAATAALREVSAAVTYGACAVLASPPRILLPRTLLRAGTNWRRRDWDSDVHSSVHCRARRHRTRHDKKIDHGRAVQPFGFRPRRSGLAAFFPHPALPGMTRALALPCRPSADKMGKMTLHCQGFRKGEVPSRGVATRHPRLADRSGQSAHQGPRDPRDRR